MSFKFQMTKVVLRLRVFLQIAIYSNSKMSSGWQFNVGRWSDLAPDKPCLPDSQRRISPEQLWIKCFTNYSLSTSSWILNTITLCPKTFKIFYLMGTVHCSDSNDSRGLFWFKHLCRDERDCEPWQKVLREYWVTHVLLLVISQDWGVQTADWCGEEMYVVAGLPLFFYLLGQPPARSINDKSLLIFY